MLGSEGGDVEQGQNTARIKGQVKKVEEVHQQSWFAREGLEIIMHKVLLHGVHY